MGGPWKDHSWFSQIPIVAMSGAVGTPELHEFLAAAIAVGANRTLAKPFSEAELLTVIDDALERGRSRSIR
jgi:CheY-like chemotaxis protein